MSIIELLLGLIAITGIGISFWLYLQSKKSTPKSKTPEQETIKQRASVESASTAEANAQAREIVVEAKDQALRIRQEAEAEVDKLRRETFELEKKFSTREAVLNQKEEEINKREQDVVNQQRGISRKLSELDKLSQDQIEKLESVASLTKEEARARILSELESHLTDDIARHIKESEEVVRERSDERARDILISAIQQAGTDYVAEYTVSRVKLPDEEMKGRIIGKEGRNIRALEQATGVDFDLDETPDEVRISSFDGFRREIARLSLERLIVDGRIQPSRIEEIVAKVREELENHLREEGEKLAFDAGVFGLPEEILRLLGRYKFRTSYGQNLATHSLEVMRLAAYLAEELKVDVDLVKKAALLHDIGKVLTAEVEGPHTRIGREVLEKAGFEEKLINAAESHHGEEELKSVEAMIVSVADAISGARPGARFENYEAYVKRMREFEDTALSFPGVEKAYALSAGREIRVVLNSNETDDALVTKLSHDIADKIENSLTYPGQVKVVVLREVRVESVAT